MWICLHACEFDHTVNTFLNLPCPTQLVCVHENTHTHSTLTLSVLQLVESDPCAGLWNRTYWLPVRRLCDRCSSATVRGAEDSATNTFPLVTKWTVPTTFWVFLRACPPPPPFIFCPEVHYHTNVAFIRNSPRYLVALFVRVSFMLLAVGGRRCHKRPNHADPQDELQPTFLGTSVVKACFIVVPPEKHNSEDTAHRPSSVLQHWTLLQLDELRSQDSSRLLKT